MFIRVVRANGQLITDECRRVIHNVKDNQIEIEIPYNEYRVIELDKGDRVFLMNDQGRTFDSVTIGE